MLWLTLAAVLRAGLLASWLFLKPVLGWFFIVIGLIGMPMPIVNGLIFLVIGITLVGHRNRQIRWSRVQIKLLLKYWANRKQPLLRWTGQLSRRSAQEISRQHRRLRWWQMERQAARRARRANTLSDEIVASGEGR
jgi:hypothetical protein